MGEIRKDNLHESLIEELNDLANIDLSGKQDKTDESLLTESKDLVGAINELFQSANNGKELIASAIGEPLNAEDTFSAMSSDINGLLSTFKTNMMNNGVTVESSDKFKALIDKIATMVEEGSGKGIQYAEGSISKLSVGVTGNLPTKKTIPYTTLGLDFKPTILFIYVETITGGSTDYFKETVNSMDNYSDATSCHGQYYNGSYFMHRMYISNITDNSFDLYTYTDLSESSFEVFLNNVNWYAIGVGEEDTTLRDSLASILEEEGISVTEEDDMASLIAKVDEEFNDKENEISNLETELADKVTPVGTAAASNVLTGKTFINSTGETITGTMANNGTKTITPKASTQTLGAGYYDKITINGDADLVAANIVSGKNIFGVTGTATKVKTVSASDNVLFSFGPSDMLTYGSGIMFQATDNATWLSVGLVTSPGTGTVRVKTTVTVNHSSLKHKVIFIQTRNGSEVARSSEFEISYRGLSTSSYSNYPTCSYDFTVQYGDKIEMKIKPNSSGTDNSNSINVYHYSLCGNLS